MPDDDSPFEPPPAPAPTRRPNADFTGTEDALQQDKNSSLLNYYFVFLALFLAVVAMVLYALHRRRKMAKARSRHNGQNALQRDVDGFMSNGRRWVGATWAARFDRHNRFGTRALERNRSVEEGLNEEGLPPPPYKAQEAHLSSHTPIPYDGPAVPLRTLSRGAAGKPPGYDEATRPRTPPPPLPSPGTPPSQSTTENGPTIGSSAVSSAQESSSAPTTVVQSSSSETK